MAIWFSLMCMTAIKALMDGNFLATIPLIVLVIGYSFFELAGMGDETTR